MPHVTEALIKASLDGTFTRLAPHGRTETDKVPVYYVPDHELPNFYHAPAPIEREYKGECMGDLWLEAMGLA